MQTNPVLEPIRSALLNKPKCWAEHQLISYLTLTEGFEWPFEPKPANLSLFKKHFLVMNALYQLRIQFAEKRWILSITAAGLVIELHTNPESSLIEASIASSLTISDQKVVEFYLDWDNYNSATEESVEILMNSFWQKYAAYLQQDDAYATLGLEQSASKQVIERRYRQLASQHHPDKGGDQNKFVEIRQAYEKLITIAG